MTGNAVGTLSVQASTGGSYTTIFTKSGNQGAAWQPANVSLAGYANQDVSLRLVVNTTDSWQGDIAVDDLKITTVSADKCDGVPAYNSNNSYSVGDQVVYQNNLFELQPGQWVNLGECGSARAILNGSDVTIPLNIISIYPNPVKGNQLFIKTAREEVTFKIYNLSGQLVNFGKVDVKSIDVSNLSSSVYLIELNDGDQTVVKRFVKK